VPARGLLQARRLLNGAQADASSLDHRDRARGPRRFGRARRTGVGGQLHRHADGHRRGEGRGRGALHLRGTFAPEQSTITSKPAAFERVKSATLGYSSFIGTSVQCKLDGVNKPCSFGVDHKGTVTFANLAEGAHSFQVTALSANGNPSEPSASASWVVDTVAPDTTLDPAVGPGEGALQTVNTETFKLGSSEPAGATFECSLDDAASAPCESAVTVGELTPGKHSFQARTIDRAGNVDASAARRTWTIAVPDLDGDGFNANIDCNDAVAPVHPGANDVAGNGVDENCDGADASAGAPAPRSSSPRRAPPSRSS
jgi:hypothetical protein